MGVSIEMGMTADRTLATQEPAMLDVGELLATRLLVQGNSGSGKSHLLRRIMEQSAPHVQQVVIDPEGDFTSLADKYGHIVIDADRTEAELVTIANRIRQHRVSAVLNLESLDVDNQMRAAGWFLNALFEAPRDLWYPILIVVDEAQLFAPSASGDAAEDARKLSLGAMTNLMCRGRKRGLCGAIATQRLAKLAKNVAAEASNFLMGRTFLDIDMARAADLLGIDMKKAEMFRELPQGNFVGLGPAVSRKPKPFRAGDVMTQARGSTPKLAPPMESTSIEVREMILAAVPTGVTRPIVPRRVMPEPPPIDDLLAQVALGRPEEALDVQEGGPEGIAASQGDAATPGDGSTDGGGRTPSFRLPGRPMPTVAPVVDESARLQATRTILAEIMQSSGAYERQEAELYTDYKTQCRIRRVVGGPLLLPEFREHLMVAKAGIGPDEVDSDEWVHAREVADGVPESERLVYLYLARAAKNSETCPSDMSIARLCGMASAGRAGLMVDRLTKATFIQSKTDIRGQRTVSFPDLGWSTEPGSAKADRATLPLAG